MNKVLALAAHPDDETLGCGGTLAKHIDKGDDVSVWIMANNYRSPDIFNDMSKAMDILGVSKVKSFNCKDSYLDITPVLDLARMIERELDKEGLPDIVYTHSATDLSTDHRKTCEVVLTVFRPVWGKHVDIYSFYTPSSTDWSGQPFQPNTFCNIECYIEIKKRAFSQYITEIREYPHPRSLENIEASARYWGSHAGLKYAEPFKLIRRVI